MNMNVSQAGSVPVGYLSELDAIRAACVLYLRLWAEGPESKADLRSDFTLALGVEQGERTLDTFEALCNLCRDHGRRPLMRHSVTCKCLGSDESCFSNFVATAAQGDREDAMLIATLLVRPDMAPALTGLAADFGLALLRMRLREAPGSVPTHLGLSQVH